MQTETAEEVFVKACFAYKLAELLARDGMKSCDLAATVDVTPVTVTNWTHGKNVPQLRHLVKLCALFNVTPRDLFPDTLS